MSKLHILQAILQKKKVIFLACALRFKNKFFSPLSDNQKPERLAKHRTQICKHLRVGTYIHPTYKSGGGWGGGGGGVMVGCGHGCRSECHPNTNQIVLHWVCFKVDLILFSSYFTKELRWIIRTRFIGINLETHFKAETYRPRI